MKCKRCTTGRVFLDRVFSDNQSLETSCLHCGDRRFISRGSDEGKWLTQLEKQMQRAENGLV